MELVKLLTVTLWLVTYRCSAKENSKYVQPLTQDALHSVLEKEGVTCLYFYKKDVPHVTRFLKEYEKSAEAIKPYGVTFYKADCKNEKSLEHCTQPEVYNRIFVYKDGRELLDLGLDTMFDVNAILSNVLQVVLLNEVPIIQNMKSRISRESKSVGTSDIIFSYQKAIGTYEHRILMEVAYAYSNKYRFMLTTDEDTVKDLPGYDASEESAVWFFPCSSIPKQMKKHGCHQMAVKFTGHMDLPSLAKFVRVLEIPAVHDVAQDGAFNPYEENEIHSVFIFYDEMSHKQVLEEVEDLVVNFRGTAGIIMVDVGSIDPLQFGYDTAWNIPALAVKKFGDPEFHKMPDQESPDYFIFEVLLGKTTKMHNFPFEMEGDELKDGQGASYDGSDEERWSALADDDEANYAENLSEVEIQDDIVAEAVSRMQDTPIPVNHLPALTDVTFPSHTMRDELTIVLFYVEFDARGAAFLRSFAHASQKLWEELSQEPLATVNCFDWTDVCGKVNVTSYPTLRIYRPDKQWVEYKGLLSTDAIVQTVKLYLLNSPVSLTSLGDVDAFIKGPSKVTMATDISVVGAFSSKDKEALEMFHEVAENLQGKMAFGLVTDSKSEDVLASAGVAQTPAIVVYKRHDAFEPYTTLNLPGTSEDLARLIVESSLCVMPELTAENYPAYHARNQPFVIFFTPDDDSDVRSMLGQLAASGQLSGVIVSWMKLSKDHPLTERILEFYTGLPLPETALVMLNHSNKAIYLYDDEVMSIKVDDFLTWVQLIERGDIPPSKYLMKKEWKPRNPGYDFLRMMDEDTRKQRGNHEALDEDEDEYLDQIVGNERPGDEEVRSELQGLRNSRLFHKAPFKSAVKNQPDVAPGEDEGMALSGEGGMEHVPTPQHKPHVEL